MPEIGQTLSHFRIVEKIGEGGMGEVYLADDTTLDRKVALKFLPEAFTSDPERMARFEREAKLLASLNHPNIAGIYGLEQADGNRFLVLEYVEGETLQARLSKGALPLEEALELCRQITEGLEAAHEKGVIHRDLKPANVMITADEKIKILDFGLAKAFSSETQSIDSSQSPTLTEAMTQPGVILGTAAYMSPEQAKGKSVDKRADIWAFGCILYECLTGKRAFGGETVTETLAAILRGEPEFELVPANARLLVQKCLAKDRKNRLRDIGDGMVLLEGFHTTASETNIVRHSWIAWSTAALLLLALIVLSVLFSMREPASSTELMRFDISPAITLAPEHSFALSPDGRMLAFAGMGRNGVESIWVRNIDSDKPKHLAGTESSYIPPFFWSPDSRQIAFNTEGKLKKIDVFTGSIKPICDVTGYAAGGSWNQDDVILFGIWGKDGSVMSIHASGGDASKVTVQEGNHLYPTFLPDGIHFLYWCPGGIRIGSLNLKPENQNSTILVETPYMPLYIQSEDPGLGYLLYIKEDMTLRAQPFDEKGLKMVGEAKEIAEDVGGFMAFGCISASTNGVLIYRNSGVQIRQPTWFDIDGNKLGTIGDPGEYNGIALSPDQSQVAVSWTVDQTNISGDIWLHDLLNDDKEQRLTYGQNIDYAPIWSPDGRYIVFASRNISEGYFNLYKMPVTGTGERKLLLGWEEHTLPTSWSKDRRFLMFCAMGPNLNEGDLWVLPMDKEEAPIPYLQTDSIESYGCFSPDMQWIAYVSDGSGRNEIYLKEFSDVTLGKSTNVTGRMISTGGGMDPKWNKNGTRLYYRSLDGYIMVVDIDTKAELQIGKTRSLFSAPLGISIFETLGGKSTWGIAADEKRLLIEMPWMESSSPPYKAILNWTKLLEK